MPHSTGVDVVMLTKNSVKPCLKESLDSIYRNVPVSRLIVIDGYSTDGTLDMLKGYERVRIITDRSRSRAVARQVGINEVEAEWFMFVDSDVVLCDNWFNLAKPYLDKFDIGAVWGAALQKSIIYSSRYDSMRRLYGKDETWIAVKAGRRRGFTHDTIIRKKAIEGISIPSSLHVLEDHYIRVYIESKGYKWLSVPKPCCLHYAHERERPRDWYIFGRCSKITGFLPLKTIVSYLFLGPYKTIWIYLNSRSIDAAKMQYQTYLYTIKGWLSV